MGRPIRTTMALIALAAATAAPAAGGDLDGSRSSMIAQNGIARANDLTFIRTSGEVERLVRLGLLVEVEGNEDYRISRVSFPYARPEVRTFVERLARQYREATGEVLVVTSLTRPATRQPRNSHPLSVHPAGIAVDLRVPATPAARAWLNSALLQMEEDGLIDATREHYPPHYHIAVFPDAYRAYVAARLAEEAAQRAELADRLAQEARRRAAEAPLPRMASAQSLSAGPRSQDGAGGWVAFAGVLLILGALGARVLALPRAR